MYTCPLCLDTCKIPIQLKCFSCYSKHDIHCNSFQRVCLSCYLEKPITNCFYCHATVLHADFEIDYSSIQNDSFNIYTCPICHQCKGTHLEYTKHVWNNHVYHCQCNRYLLKSNLKLHVEECKECLYCLTCKKDTITCSHRKHKMKCVVCKLEVEENDIVSHYLTHIHDYKVNIKFLKSALHQERTNYHTLLETIEKTLQKK